MEVSLASAVAKLYFHSLCGAIVRVSLGFFRILLPGSHSSEALFSFAMWRHGTGVAGFFPDFYFPGSPQEVSAALVLLMQTYRLNQKAQARLGVRVRVGFTPRGKPRHGHLTGII